MTRMKLCMEFTNYSVHNMSCTKLNLLAIYYNRNSSMGKYKTRLNLAVSILDF